MYINTEIRGRYKHNTDTDVYHMGNAVGVLTVAVTTFIPGRERHWMTTGGEIQQAFPFLHTSPESEQLTHFILIAPLQILKM